MSAHTPVEIRSIAGLTFDEGAHAYYFDGVRVPSVTSVLAPIADLGMVAPDILRAASEFGTAVHRACELADRNDLDRADLDPHLQPYVDAWAKFCADYETSWAGIELRVYHPRLRYGGTLDRVGTVKGEHAIVDIKSGTQLYASVGPQLAAYAHAYAPLAMMGPLLLKRYAVQLKGDGTYRLQQYTDATDWSVFCSLLTLRTWAARHQITPVFEGARNG